MPRYHVNLITTASTYVTVEADDPDEAMDKAMDEEMPAICAQCSGWGRDQNLELADEWDIDGEPYEVEE